MQLKISLTKGKKATDVRSFPGVSSVSSGLIIAILFEHTTEEF